MLPLKKIVLLKDLSYPIVCVPIHKLSILLFRKSHRTNVKTKAQINAEKYVIASNTSVARS